MQHYRNAKMTGMSRIQKDEFNKIKKHWKIGIALHVDPKHYSIPFLIFR